MEFDKRIDEQDPSGMAGARVGALLKKQREAKGLTLADVERETRVPKRHLAAIEADTHDSLPALPFTIGFVKSFARAVGLPPEQIAAQFRAETTKTVHVPQNVPLEPLDERRVPSRRLVLISTLVIAAVIGGVAAFDWFGGEMAPPVASTPVAGDDVAELEAAEFVPTIEEVAPVVDPGAASAGGAATSADAAAVQPPATTPVAAPIDVPSGPVVIAATEDAWLKVYDRTTGKSVKMGILKAGESYEVPADPNLLLWTGRAGALRISIGDQVLKPLGGPTETVRDVSLAPADLISRLG